MLGLFALLAAQQSGCQLNGVDCGVLALQSAITSSAPPPCPALLPDTLTGTLGTQPICSPRQDSTRPTPVQAINTTLAADCTWSVIFGRTTTSPVPIVNPIAILPVGLTQPVPCSPTARSSTGASGKCFPAQTTTLASVTVAGVSVTAGGATVNPTGTTCTAGMPVMVVVREPTQ